MAMKNPRGPGFREVEIASSVDGRHVAARQQIYQGSFALLETEHALLEQECFMLDLWIWPTLPDGGSQGLLSWRAEDTPAALCLALDAAGRVVARSDDRELIRSREALALPAPGFASDLEGRDRRLFLSVAPARFCARPCRAGPV